MLDKLETAYSPTIESITRVCSPAGSAYGPPAGLFLLPHWISLNNASDGVLVYSPARLVCARSVGAES